MKENNNIADVKFSPAPVIFADKIFLLLYYTIFFLEFNNFVLITVNFVIQVLPELIPGFHWYTGFPIKKTTKTIRSIFGI